MRKILCLLLCLILSLTIFSGCNTVFNMPTETITVITTNFALYSFACEIGQNNANVEMLLSPGQESHNFEPSPKDVISIQKSNLFLYIGGESEAWVNDLIDSIDTSNTKVVSLIDCVDLLEEELKEGMEANNDNSEKEIDEHIWTSPVNAVKIVEKIGEVFSEVDYMNADFYSQNTQNYIRELNKLDVEFSKVVSNAKRKTVVFADRFPFRYLADEFSLDCYAAFPGCSSQSEPSAATVAFLIDKVKNENIPVVFYIEFSNQKMADTVCEATGAKKMLLHSCHNVTKEDFDNSVTYLSIMNNNLEALREALS